MLVVSLLSIVGTSLYKQWQMQRAFAHAFANNSFCTDAKDAKGYFCLPVYENPPEPKVLHPDRYNLSMALFVGEKVAQMHDATRTQDVSAMHGLAKVAWLRNHGGLSSCPIGAVFRSPVSGDYFIILRGSHGKADWIQDLYLNSQAVEESHFSNLHFDNTPPMVRMHGGFGEGALNCSNSMPAEIWQTKKMVYIAGHSLGAAIATVLGVHFRLRGLQAVVYAFASPRVGNCHFSELVDRTLKMPLFRIVNESDVVPFTPFAVTPRTANNVVLYQHCGKLVLFSANWQSLRNNHDMVLYLQALRDARDGVGGAQLAATHVVLRGATVQREQLL